MSCVGFSGLRGIGNFLCETGGDCETAAEGVEVDRFGEQDKGFGGDLFGKVGVGAVNGQMFDVKSPASSGLSELEKGLVKSSLPVKGPAFLVYSGDCGVVAADCVAKEGAENFREHRVGRVTGVEYNGFIKCYKNIWVIIKSIRDIHVVHTCIVIGCCWSHLVYRMSRRRGFMKCYKNAWAIMKSIRDIHLVHS